MRVLVYTSLYPGAGHPGHGIFVAQLVKELAGLARVRVLAPESGYGWLAALLRRPVGPVEPIVMTEHCRFWTIPKVFKSLDGRFMAWWSRASFDRALAFGPDLIHAHYAYPDAAAAAELAARAGLPLVVTCHGSDINVLARDPARRPAIARALNQAAAVLAVSRDLAGKIAGLGVDPARIRHMPNGVNLDRFPLADKAQSRRRLRLAPDVPVLLAAGRLEPVKGYDRLLRALALLPDVHLVLVGQGGQEGALRRLAGELGLARRVRFDGQVAHGALATYYQAADALALASHSEGWPTVIHEALACGTPVVAPAVGGIAEALADPRAGVLLPSADPRTLAEGIRRVLALPADPAGLRRIAAAHDWRFLAARHVALYARVLCPPTHAQEEVSHAIRPRRVACGHTAASAP